MMKAGFVVFVCIFLLSFGNSQTGVNYNDQQKLATPYPYQTVLGLQQPREKIGTIYPQGPYQYPINYGGVPVQPPINQNASQSGFNELLPQAGFTNYHPYPSYGYPYGGYPYPAPGYSYPYGYPGYGYSVPGVGPNSIPPQGHYSLKNNNEVSDPYADIKAEVIDVSPEYQRQLLGLPEEYGGASEVQSRSKPRYRVKVDSQSSNVTSIPGYLSKPILTQKSFSTTIRRSFIYDPSNPEKPKPIYLHLVNGEEVTTDPPPTTTESEDVEGKSSATTKSISGRRFMDVPTSCPDGTLLAHSGDCIEPFLLRSGLKMPTNNRQIIQYQRSFKV